MEELKYCYKYPHPSVTTDCVIFGFDGTKLRVLLIERGIEPFKGKWALPGGFLRMDEDAETGALRELKEETGLDAAYIKQFHTFTTPNRDPRERVITIAYYALVRLQEVTGGDDAARAEWYALDKVPALAFDHDQILRMASYELKRQIHFHDRIHVENVGCEYGDSRRDFRPPQLLQEDAAPGTAQAGGPWRVEATPAVPL